MKRLDMNSNEGSVGFQIAPMIDVVFVIMLFFMVMAGAVKVEKELNSQLPGVAETSGGTDFVDEQMINITESGEISINDEPMDSNVPTDSSIGHDLPQLKGTLLAKTPVIVTIVSEGMAKYSRTVDVLNALAVAKIDSVSFTVTEDE